MSLRISIVLLLVVSWCSGQAIAVKQHVLENGMKVLVHEDHDVPNIAMYLFFTVGSRNEQPGTTGLSHFFEHMMFNGAKKYGPKQFDIVLEKAGGSNNAYTSKDVTVYTNFLPDTALELMFEMEADRLKDLALLPEMVASEREVVSNERRMAVDNNPFGTLYEQVNAAAYIAHPYQWPVIGWASDIEQWTREELENHYRMGYAPNNCTVVIAGAVSETEVLRLAKTYFEPIPRQDPPPAVRTVEPQQNGERRVSVYRRAQLPMQMVSWHIPPTRHEDNPSLTVLGALLSQGRSSRLYRRMVDGELALRAQCGSNESLDPGQFFCVVSPRTGVEPETSEKVLFEEIEKLRTEVPSARELQKAKNQLLADYYRELKTIANKANFIGNHEVFHGDWRKLNDYEAAIKAVSQEDVKRVASKYLSPRNRTVGTLIPEQSEEPEQSKEEAQ